jgi:hypothetical protein
MFRLSAWAVAEVQYEVPGVVAARSVREHHIPDSEAASAHDINTILLDAAYIHTGATRLARVKGTVHKS